MCSRESGFFEAYFLKQSCKLKIRRKKVRESKTFSYGVVKRETNFQVDICHMLLVRMKVTFSFVINWRYGKFTINITFRGTRVSLIIEMSQFLTGRKELLVS